MSKIIIQVGRRTEAVERSSVSYEATSEPELGKGSWNVPGRNQGQIVEVAYAEPFLDSAGAEFGAMYRRTTDRSTALRINTRSCAQHASSATWDARQ